MKKTSKKISVFINKKLRHFLTSKKRFLVVYGGRGGSKSYQVADILIVKATSERNIVILCAKQLQTSIKDSVYSLLKSRIISLELDQYFEFVDAEIRCLLTGTKFIFKGLSDVENTLKSLSEIKYCWVEEAQTLHEDTWRVLTPSIRAKDSQIFVTFNPRNEDDIVYKEFILKQNQLAEVVELNYYDNPFFPEVLRLEMEKDKEEDVINYEYVWEGKIKKIDPKALWKRHYIQHLTSEQKESFSTHELERIVVALDPSITSSNTSDACGIIVAGKFVRENRYIVLEDYTMVASPIQWATKAIQLYQDYQADRIVAEVNQGGDIIESLIRTISKNVAYKGVYASRGKIVRAEPISGMYELGLVVHAKIFKELEKELLTYTGPEMKSPNRLDALVWALTELSGRGVKAMQGTVKSTTIRNLGNRSKSFFDEPLVLQK